MRLNRRWLWRYLVITATCDTVHDAVIDEKPIVELDSGLDLVLCVLIGHGRTFYGILWNIKFVWHLHEVALVGCDDCVFGVTGELTMRGVRLK